MLNTNVEMDLFKEREAALFNRIQKATNSEMINDHLVRGLIVDCLLEGLGHDNELIELIADQMALSKKTTVVILGRGPSFSFLGVHLKEESPLVGREIPCEIFRDLVPSLERGKRIAKAIWGV